MRKRWRWRTPGRLAVGGHVARGEGWKMNRLEFKALASMNGENAHAVDIRCFGRDRPVHTLIVERFDAPDPRQKSFAAGKSAFPDLAANLEELVDGGELLLRVIS